MGGICAHGFSKIWQKCKDQIFSNQFDRFVILKKDVLFNEIFLTYYVIPLVSYFFLQ